MTKFVPVTKMKLLIRILFGILITVILLSFCDSWLFGNSDYDWLDNLNDHSHEEDEFDWNGEIRAKRGERKYFEENEEPLVHNQRCDACRIIGNRVHIGFEVAESKLGIRTHSFDEEDELGEFLLTASVLCHAAPCALAVARSATMLRRAAP